METRWYIPPGETLSSTKIVDRGLALHVTKDAWKGILGHLDRGRRMREIIEKEKARKIFLKEESQQMAKQWDDSVENKRRRHEEERRARLAQVDIDRMERFMVLRAEQKAIREKFIVDARKAIYISHGPPRDLTGALILSEVLYEREKQKELDQFIKQHDIKTEAKYAEQVKIGAEQEKMENLEKERKIKEKKLEMRKLYLQQINEKEQLVKTTRETRIAREMIDHRNGDYENSRIKQQERETAEEKNRQAKKEFEDYHLKQQKLKEILKIEDKEQDLVIDIYSKAKFKIDCLRKKKELEMQKALQIRQAAIAKKIGSDATAKMAEEERVIRKGVAERAEEELEKLRIKEDYRKMLIKERQEDRRRFVEREEKRKFDEMEQRKWELLNRVKSDSVVKEYDENKKQKEWQKKLNYRSQLFEQMAEDEVRLGENYAEYKRGYDLNQFTREDTKVLKYADECLDYARKRGRSTIPVERVILGYKRANRLPVPIFKTCQSDLKDGENDKQKSSTGSQSDKPLTTKPLYNVDCRCFR